jgi:hypothetical protein
MPEKSGKIIRKIMASPGSDSTINSECQPKEIWQMTKAEYEFIDGQLRANTTVTGRFSPHMSTVETALNRGFPVPAAVLADHPSHVV